MTPDPTAETTAPPPEGDTAQSRLLDRYAHSLLPVFGRPQLVLTHGSGSHVWDADGRRYLDLLAGIAVNALGHAHPALVAAVRAQAERMIHISNFFTSAPQIELAETLLRLAGAPEGSAVFFTNSGTEAIEAAIKLSRRTGRTRLLAAEGAFHGRSTGALALTHKAAYREPFAPLLGDVTHLPYNDGAALRATFERDGAAIAALVLEPTQGEAGVVPASADYLRLARELCTRHGALLILDEVQTGVGRTGRWFDHERAGIRPDAMTLAKGLAGGVPIGAMITYGPAVTGLLTAGQHGSTFGGNPLACAAGLAVCQTLEQEHVLDDVRLVGDKIAAGVRGLAHPRIAEVRGEGLLLGISLRDEGATALAAGLLQEGIIVNAPNPATLRLAPSLLLSPDEADTFVEALHSLLDERAAP
ncbi:MAG: acetylornithine transaminase [Austwickia sp.]|jgi:acetylornithine/N-succinyldiaminopimelate aminotransferase|nr:MAG: acetylornithine transaminase [Austwickia sp.]